MSPRAARQIRAGILIARQVMRRERLGPASMDGLTLRAYHVFRRRHIYVSPSLGFVRHDH